MKCGFVCVCVEEYQELVDDIVRDGRLYATHQHQDVLTVSRMSDDDDDNDDAQICKARPK